MRAKYTLPGAPRAYVQATLEGLHVRVATSDPSDGVHQAWFGACGVGRAGHVLREARRVFQARVFFKSATAHLARETSGAWRHTLLGSVRGVRCRARSSCTPWGMFPAKDFFGRAPLFFEQDANEDAVIVYVGAEQVRGAPDLDALARLVQGGAAGAPAAPPAAPRHGAPALRLPRVALVGHVHELDYLVQRCAEHGATALVVSMPDVHVSLQGTYAERVGALRAQWLGRGAGAGGPAAEPAPLQYAADVAAGVGALDVSLSTEDGSCVRHYDILRVHALDFEFAARAPAAVDVRTWAPDVQLRAARTRAAVSVEHVDVDLWHRPVLDALAALMRALDAPVAHARRPAAARARVLDRLPPLRYAHVGLGALHVFVGGLDPDDGAPVERGLALQVGQTSLDFGRV